MDKKRNNIVVSRRAVLEETRAEARSEIVSTLEEGQILDGIVKNITDYGAFVDLGGVDGLLQDHATPRPRRTQSHRRRDQENGAVPGTHHTWVCSVSARHFAAL